MSDSRAYLLLLAVVVFWSGNFPLGKLALHEVGPLTLTAGRALIAAPVLLVIAYRTAPRAVPFGVVDWITFAVLGLTGLAGNTTIWFWGLQHTTALNAGILGAASPVFVAIAAALVLGDRLSLRSWAGIGLSVAGVLLTVAQGSLEVLLTFRVNPGDPLILASQALWVTYSLCGRASPSTLPAVWIMAGAHVVGGAVLIPLAVIFEPWRSPLTAPLGWAVVMYGAVLVTLGHLWYYAALRTLGAGRAAAFTNLMPFVVILLSWALVGEAVHLYHLIGAATVIGGVLLMTRRGG